MDSVGGESTGLPVSSRSTVLWSELSTGREHASLSVRIFFVIKTRIFFGVEVTSNYSGGVWVKVVWYFRDISNMWWRVERKNADWSRVKRNFDTCYIAGG